MWLKLLSGFKMFREELIMMFFAWRHPDTPKYIKTLFLAAIGYLISPIDVIPDYMPVVGMLDDLTIVPAMVYFLTNMLPRGVKRDCEEKTERLSRKMPYIFGVLLVISIIWVGFVIWLLYKLITYLM